MLGEHDIPSYPENVIWRPQRGSQEAFLASTCIFEVLYQGARGGGKTDALVMAFSMHTGRGYGPAWKGILFRQTYKQLTDVISKTKKWFNLIWPSATYNNSDNVWTWPGGEQLLLRHFNKSDDYWNYHGHEYPFIAWEELCNWPTDEGYKRMISCCRSSNPNVPRMLRATTNPYGPGHNWVKNRFLPDQYDRVVRRGIIDEDGREQPPRLSIFSKLKENKVLLEADPTYIEKLAASARNEAEKKAWLDGSWDIVSGGMFDDVWDPAYNLIKPFEIPAGWKIDRSFDWGSSRPFSVGWWATSNGEPVQLSNGEWRPTVRGDLFRIKEWYGCSGKPNEGLGLNAVEISKGIVEREVECGWRDPKNPSWCRVSTGVADSQIFSTENGSSIAGDMQRKVVLDNGVAYNGISWHPADKRAGSRITGWDQMRRMLKDAHPTELGARDRAGLFIFNTCGDWVRTIPVLTRADNNLDDIDTTAEDHIADETRYRVRFIGNTLGFGKVYGHY